MTSVHPSLLELQSLLQDPGTEQGVREGSGAIRHILRGCSSCRAYLRGKMLHRDPGDQLPDVPVPGASEPERNYDSAFEAAEEMVSLLSSPSSLDLLNELLTHQGATRSFPESHRSVPRLVKWLVASSHAIRYDNPDRMLNLANMARLAAEACAPTDAADRYKLADLRASAWAQFGNALRMRGSLLEAEEALITAFRRLASGTGDLEVRAGILQRMASFHALAERLPEAARAADEAGAIFVRLGDYHQYASTLIQKGMIRIDEGSPEESFLLLKQALPLVDCDEEPEILLAARHNLMRCYLDLGKTVEAAVLAHETDAFFAGLRNPLLLLRLKWQQGELMRDLGHLHAAEKMLCQARQGFLEWGLPHEFARTSLDLSSLYACQGADSKVQQIAQETVPLCQALQMKKEALALLLQAGDSNGNGRCH